MKKKDKRLLSCTVCLVEQRESFPIHFPAGIHLMLFLFKKSSRFQYHLVRELHGIMLGCKKKYITEIFVNSYGLFRCLWEFLIRIHLPATKSIAVFGLIKLTSEGHVTQIFPCCALITDWLKSAFVKCSDQWVQHDLSSNQKHCAYACYFSLNIVLHTFFYRVGQSLARCEYLTESLVSVFLYDSSNWENHSYSIVMSDLITIWRPHTECQRIVKRRGHWPNLKNASRKVKIQKH